MKRRTIFHMKHAYHVVKPFSLKPLSSFGPGDHLSHQFFTDFFFILSICLNDDVCRRFIFFTAFLHKFCDKFYALIFLQQRPVMIVLRSLKNGFRTSCQQDGSAAFLHLCHIAIPHSYSTATGNHDSGTGSHLLEKFCFQLPEISLTMNLKDI